MIVREATPEDIFWVVHRMRVPDAAEQFASRFIDDSRQGREQLAGELIQAAPIAIKHYALCADDGTAIALVGAFLHAPGVAAINQVATDRWPEIALSATKFYRRQFIPHVLAPNVRLAECLIAANNETTLRWFDSLGFTVVSVALPYGKNGERFVLTAWLAGDDDV